MAEEKLVGSYLVCVNCGTKVSQKDGEDALSSCDYCGKNNLVKVEVRVLKERANADGMRVGFSNAFFWGAIFFLFGNGNLDWALLGVAAGFLFAYFPEKKAGIGYGKKCALFTSLMARFFIRVYYK